MAKEKVKFVCQQCGGESPKFLGRCPSCGEWNSLVETVVSTRSSRFKVQDSREKAKPVLLSEIKVAELQRIKTGLSEWDRVLGGGLVLGQVVLLAGEPGVGKSTLLLQVAVSLAPVLYVSGEESVEQISLHAKRLGIVGKESRDLSLLAETNVENIIESMSQRVNDSQTLLIVDSVQTLWTEELTGTPGSVGQVRESARRLALLAKEKKIPLIMVGHVTKEGAIAGPKVLEHLVDTVLYLEGERFGPARLLRVTKNRFGPTDEVGVFKMRQEGISEISNPSELFFEKRKENLPGSAMVVILEGTRPLLVEIQALVAASELKVPRRVGNGISYYRLSMINAILTKHLRLPLGRFDVYVNVSGGLKISEPAADLAIALTIYTSLKNKPLPAKAVCLGELSLLGEIRRVSNLEKRVKEAKRLGFSKVFSSKEFSHLRDLTKKL